MKFSDLTFTPPKEMHGNEQAIVFFPNGFGASIVRGRYSYGGPDGLYELAVIKGTAVDDWTLCYTTPITEDVEGHLTEDDVTALLIRIERHRVKWRAKLDSKMIRFPIPWLTFSKG